MFDLILKDHPVI